ncbi:MAG: hypothetical protein WA843_01445 [Candidatus Saccharimonadales bacterium]
METVQHHNHNTDSPEMMLPAAQVIGYATPLLTSRELDGISLEIPRTVDKLTEDEAYVGFFWYLDNATEPGQSYPIEKGQYGAIQHAANNTGISPHYIGRAIKKGKAEALLGIKQRSLKGTNGRSDVILFEQGRQHVAELQTAQPRLIESAKEFIMQHRQQIVVWVRHEVNKQRIELHERAYIFKGIFELTDLDHLDKHLAWLRAQQQAGLMDLGH